MITEVLTLPIYFGNGIVIMFYSKRTKQKASNFFLNYVQIKGATLQASNYWKDYDFLLYT